MPKIFVCCCMLTLFYANAQQPNNHAPNATKKMQPLFNGKNLDGWYSFLRTKGKNSDPEKVFAVEDGQLHISGKEFGYISTENVYKNFHLVAEFKWGIKKYPPRDADSTKRDNGICFYVPLTAKDLVWPKLIECQVQEGDVGDIWLVDGVTLEISGVRTQPDSFHRVVKKLNAELPTGQWNRLEIIANRGKIKYIVNNQVVNEAENPSINEGKILVQSEGAEIYYRKIEIAEL